MPSIAAQGRRLATGAPALLVLAFVVACSSVENWSEVREPPQPRVRLVTYHHTALFPPRSAALSADERRRLARFLAETAPAYGDTVEIASGAAATVETAEGEGLAERRRRTVASLVPSTGAEMRDGVADDGAIPVGAVSVTVERYVVALPDCPDWSDPPGRSYDNQPSRNLGCATAKNFGIMVANPRDLVRGRALSPADGERQARSIELYRKDEAKSPTGEGASQGGPTLTLTAE